MADSDELEDVRAMEDTTVLVDLGEGMTKDDGCSKAYEKFKAEIDKMTTLKDKAAKEKEAADKKERESTAGLKRCNDDHKEILDKATYKKEVADKKIKEAVKTQFDAKKKEVEDKAATDAEKKCKEGRKQDAEDTKAKVAKDKKEF